MGDREAAAIIFAMVVLSCLAGIRAGTPLEQGRGEAAGHGAHDGDGLARPGAAGTRCGAGRGPAARMRDRSCRSRSWCPGDVVHLSRRRPGAGRSAPDRCQGPVRQSGVADRRGAAGGEACGGRTAPRPPTSPQLRNICFMGTNVVSGTATGVVALTGPHAYFGSLAEIDRRRARADELRSGHQPLRLADDPLHPGHGAAGIPDQRPHQGRLDRGAAVRDGRRSRAHARDAADDRHREPGQGRARDVAQARSSSSA